MATLPNSRTVTGEEWLRMAEVSNAIGTGAQTPVFCPIAQKQPLTSRVSGLAVFQLKTMGKQAGYMLSPGNAGCGQEEKLVDYTSTGVLEVWFAPPESWAGGVFRSAHAVMHGVLQSACPRGLEPPISTVWPD
jgi:hypothetical protein